jgi:hypothetical protein
VTRAENLAFKLCFSEAGRLVSKESGMAGEARARRFKADNGRGVRHSVVKKEREDVGVEDNDKARVRRPGSNGGELDGEEWGLSQRL